MLGGAAGAAAPGRLFVLRGPGGAAIPLPPALSGDCRRAAVAVGGQIHVLDRKTGADTLASVAPDGAPGDGDSGWPVLSDDGRIVAFGSFARNLLAEPPRQRFGGYLRDLATGATLPLASYRGGAALSGDGRTLVYLGSAAAGGRLRLLARDVASGRTLPVAVPGGGLPDGDALLPALSFDGGTLAFASSATNLVPGDLGGEVDVFVLDRGRGAVERISTGPGGAPADGPSDLVSLDASGRLVAFASDATNLVAGDRNGVRDVFLHDRATGVTVLASRAAGGAPADGASDHPALSRDGRLLAFSSRAGNLVPGDANGVADVFVLDREGGSVTRFSESDAGVEADDESGTTGLVWSADGRCLAFQSWAANLLGPGGGGRHTGEDFFVRELRPPRWRGAAP